MALGRRSPRADRMPRRAAGRAALVLAALCLCALIGPSGRAATAPIERGPSDVRAIAFACNVVWGTEYVLPIARAFAAGHSRATFFLGGAWAAAHPAEAGQLRRMGMEIASHGYGHRHVASLSVAENLAEIDKANAAIRAATGVTPRLYAPAYGEMAPAVQAAAALRRMPVVLWSVDTVDWRTWHTAAIIRERVLTRARPGAIVLIHPTDRTLAALPGVIAALRAQGYRLETVSDLLKGTKARPEGPTAQAR